MERKTEEHKMTDVCDYEDAQNKEHQTEKGPIILENKVELKRELGLPGAISLCVGSVIGSGIFISPKGVLMATRSVGLCLTIWVVAGLMQLGNALCFSEMGTLIPKAGGQYTYLRQGLGNPLAFTYMLQTIIIQSPGSNVIILMTCAKYLVTLFPTCSSPVVIQKLIVVLLLLSLNIVNAYSVRWGARVTILTTVAKVLALVVIIIGGIVVMAQGTLNELPSGFSGTTQDLTSIAVALYSAQWAYSGSEGLNVLVEEIKNPFKNLPRAAIMGILLVIVVYTLTNISYLAVMTRAELIGASAVAVLWGERVLGAATAFIPVAVTVSTLGAANNGVFGNSRVVFTAARDKNIPDVLSYIQVNHYTPLSAMIFTLTCSLILLVPAEVGTLINYLGFLSSFFDAAVFACFLIFRFKTMKHNHRPIKVPAAIAVIMFLIKLYMFLAPLVISPQLEYVFVAIGVFSVSAFVYVPFILFRIPVPYYDRVVTYIQLWLNVSPPPDYYDISADGQYGEENNLKESKVN